MQKTIEQLMTKEVVVIDFKTKFSKILEFFNEFRMNHLPVVYNDKLVGMISIRDVLATYYKHLGDPSSFTLENIDEKFKVEDIMTKDVHSIKASASWSDAAETFRNNKFRSLPVTNNEGQLIGIITPLDLI
tara:strand:- start:2038 stop:2430 length:393 start_codon:yes stop_codon:yes gene_type:complete